ncbi:uncharacterized protein G2W53_000805 [Senna tora]|uniref:Uncharacterized protein n=1 Tax=Senna tora TaxID=362788 RepID=A0A835CKX7_9FABA|nr:uncharacterized protein G2W53_000805 [Senna tora]
MANDCREGRRLYKGKLVMVESAEDGESRNYHLCKNVSDAQLMEGRRDVRVRRRGMRT